MIKETNLILILIITIISQMISEFTSSLGASCSANFNQEKKTPQIIIEKKEKKRKEIN